MTENRIVLKLEDLSLYILKDGKETPILKNINLEIREQERWAIAGASGAGKSMTMYALTSLLPEKNTRISGKIQYLELDGSYTDILTLPFEKRIAYCSKKTSLIFQDSINALNPYEKIGRQWGETVALRHPEMKKQERIWHISDRLQLFGITDPQVIRKYPHQLSGGMRQRIAIAMSLESDASILIADEPTTSLDALNQRRIVRFIQQLCTDRKLTRLYISHNLALLDDICTHVAILQHGMLIEKGTREILHHPSHPYTRELIEETRKLGRPSAPVMSQEGRD